MILSFLTLDFGASTVDAIWWNNNIPSRIISFNTREVEVSDLEVFLKKNAFELASFDFLKVTGGRSRFFPSRVFGKEVQKVDEIEAVGKGGMFLLQSDLASASDLNRVIDSNYATSSSHANDSHCINDSKYVANSSCSIDPILVVSMGTGTCMVKVENGICQHIGGTGIGGGTFLALNHLILGENDIRAIIKRYERGNVEHVDLSVSDIIGEGIGMVPAYATASNFGKIVGKEIIFSKDDLAAGIVNLIGQTIATAFVFAAQAHNVKIVVLTGKLTRVQKIMDVIFSVADMYKIRVILPKNAEYVSAIGAGV
ncbi:hypothetical protein HYV57_03195 [Candidatus Peregrinibacteria bacterium]|nr:hypothetical protein [Candidatus Peregrinibacteria bacterium]